MLRPILNGLLDLVAPVCCPGCDHALEWGERGFCSACAPLLDRLPPGPALYAFGGPLADAVRRFKYAARLDLVEPLAALLVHAAPLHAGKVDAVVPLPLHPSRLRERGFDQTALLAAPLAAALGVPLDTRRLRRIRPTPPQASLAEAQREANVRGAFEATRDETRRRVLLLDDVRTTGATLRSAAGALHRGGASQVRLMALAGVVEGRLPVARGSHL